MPKSVTLKALQKQSADYASGLAGLDAKLAELEALRKRLQEDRTATAGAKYAIDQLIAGLAGPVAVSAPTSTPAVTPAPSASGP